MLAIRLQRTGRSGHSQFRLIAQDSRFSPKRGRVVAYLGSYDPHTKETRLDTEKVSLYLNNGAQPSDSVAKLLRKEGVKLPTWVKTSQPKQRAVRSPEKRRSTRPEGAEPTAPAEADETTADKEAVAEPPTDKEPAETPAETPAEPANETSEAEPTAEPEAPAEETETTDKKA